MASWCFYLIGVQVYPWVVQPLTRIPKHQSPNYGYDLYPQLAAVAIRATQNPADNRASAPRP